MTSNTFAYWADTVVGTNTSITTTFSVGSPSFVNHEFVLTDEINTFSYVIPLEELLSDPDNSIDDVIFGIIWNDEELLEELQNLDASAEVEVTYDILITENGKEVKKWRYKRLVKLINLELDEDNPNTISYGNTPETFGFSVSLNEEQRKNDYRLLAKHEVTIVVSYTIIEDTIVSD